VNDDIKALEAACDALWGDPDEEARPYPDHVGAKAVRVMVRDKCTFVEACAKVVEAELKAHQLEAQARELRAQAKAVRG
jgi:hypothetical protein